MMISAFPKSHTGLPGLFRRSFAPKTLLLIFVVSQMVSFETANGAPSITNAADSALSSREFEEIVVNFEVQRLLNVDLFAQYDGESLYLPALRVFETLGMDVTTSEGRKRYKGYLSTKAEKLEIDVTRGKVRTPYFDGTMSAADYYIFNNNLYIRLDLFKTYFGLPLVFYFEELRVFLPLDKNFPAFQKLKRKLAHKRLRETQVEVSDALTLPRTNSYLRGGVADWSLSTNPIGGGEQFANLTAGGMLLGGDINISAAADTRQGFDASQTRMRWRRYFENKSALSQVEMGDVFNGSSLARALRGGRLTNKPITQRRFFETIDLSGDLGSNWEVELYVDGRLKDFTTTDAGGKYDFNLDVFYGASVITLKMYGPNGEVRTEERYRRIPFNLIPHGRFDYDFAVGKQNQSDSSRFYSNASASYGVTSNLTAGIGLDVPMTPAEGEKALLAGELAFQLFSNLTLNTSLSPNNELDYGLSYTQSSVNLAAGYTKFYENSTRNVLRQIDKVTLSISSPFRIKNRSVGLRFHATIDRFPTFKTTNMNYGFSASLSKVNLNYLGKYKINSSVASSSRDISSQIFATLSLSRWIRPQFRVEYSHSSGALTKLGVFFSRRVFRSGQVTLSYERNPVLKTNTATFNFSLLTDFASLSSRSIATAGGVNINQLYRGSVRYDQNTGSVLFDRNNGVGLGSAVIQPFLDENYNGRQDAGEEKLQGLRARINGAGGAARKGDNLYYYDRLRPYDEYVVQIDEYSLDDPQLKPAHDNFRVAVNPNVVTSINVPVVAASDITGAVRRATTAGPVGVGGLTVVIFNISRDMMTQVTTFNDGEYYYLGLLPGRYRAYIDPKKLEAFGYKSTPASLEFEIKPEPGGSSITDIDFLVAPSFSDVTADGTKKKVKK